MAARVNIPPTTETTTATNETANAQLPDAPSQQGRDHDESPGPHEGHLRTLPQGEAHEPLLFRDVLTSPEEDWEILQACWPPTGRPPCDFAILARSTPVAQSWGKMRLRSSTCSPIRDVRSTEMTSWCVSCPPPAAHQTLMPLLFAHNSQISRPFSTFTSRRTVSVKLPVTRTGESRPGFPTRTSPVGARCGNIRSVVSRSQYGKSRSLMVVPRRARHAR